MVKGGLRRGNGGKRDSPMTLHDLGGGAARAPQRAFASKKASGSFLKKRTKKLLSV
jgi:hypothetical protein